MGWAQYVADRLGVPVLAPVDAVGVARRPESVARVRGYDKGKGWLWFRPAAMDNNSVNGEPR